MTTNHPFRCGSITGIAATGLASTADIEHFYAKPLPRQPRKEIVAWYKRYFGHKPKQGALTWSRRFGTYMLTKTKEHNRLPSILDNL